MTRRGLTLLELLLATSITVMVGAAIVAMLGAVNAGVGSRRDTRAVMVRAAAARSRVASYVSPCRCLLATNADTMALWLDDSRTSETVHATEIRWLRLDPTTTTLNVFFVKFPNAWSQTAKDLEDLEYASNVNWDDVLNYYQKKGYISRVALIDGLKTLSFTTDQSSAINARHMSFECGFVAEDATMPVSIPATITSHNVPKN